MAEKPRSEAPPGRLRDALRQARIESAERSAVVVELHDAEVARLEIMNEALDPLFADIPADRHVFDRGISRGDPPRLWIDMVAYVALGRDKRTYRFMQDTLNGPKILAESLSVDEIARAVTSYVAHRIVERERSLAAGTHAATMVRDRNASSAGYWRAFAFFLLGVLIGAAAILAAAWVAASRL
jgi:hypothetical protein